VSSNGDGFGIAWYGSNPEPGLYRDCLPAWSDENLLSLFRLVQAPLLIAHVRASTTGSTMRANCHPFAHQNWSFAHNGQTSGFHKMQCSLESLLSDELYQARQGITDSELLFLLLLQFGLSKSVEIAFGRVIGILERMRTEMLISEPLRIAAVVADGSDLFALRYASDAYSPTLYRSKKLDNDGIAIASEPLDNRRHNWAPIMPSYLVLVSAGGVIQDLALKIS